MEPRDLVALAGLAMAATGLALISIPIALVATGATLAALAIAADRRRPR